MERRQSRSAFQTSYASETAASTTVKQAATSFGPPAGHVAHTSNGDSSSASACQKARRAMNSKRVMRGLVIACQLYAPASLALSLFLDSEPLAISGIAIASLGIGVIAGAWLAEAA